MTVPKIYKPVAILALLVLVVVILVYAKPFLIPLTFAAILSMLLLPITRWLEGKGVNKVVAILLTILVLIAFFAILIFFISWQLSDIASNSSKLEQQLTQKYGQVKQYIAETLGIPQEQQQKMLKEQQQGGKGGGMGSMITGFIMGVGSFLTNTLLVLVYIFLFLFLRARLKNFLVQLVPRTEKGNALDTVNSAQKVTQKYFTGMFIMIVCLWVLYSIGFAIAGVKNWFFFAVLCGTLEIVPFIGNIAGTAITLALSMVQGGGMNLVVGILVTYAVVQFFQTYILEPLIVGAELNINPLFTIMALVGGEILWGIPGMVMAIPVLGMFKIVCDHVETLKPYAYLIGEEKKESKLKKKIKALFGKK